MRKHKMPWSHGITAILVIIVCLTGGSEADSQGTYQRFDGYFNNPLDSDKGSAGRPLARNISTRYRDETYMPSGWDRPNPRMISNDLFQMPPAGPLWSRSKNKTAMFAFYGQLVLRELTNTDDSTCPVEILNVPVPSGDPYFDPEARGDRHMPYQRLAYDKNTGQSPNNPRKQLNRASSYIDGSFVYGNSVVRTEYMREEGTGKLACSDSWGIFPLMNDVRLPYHAYPSHHGKTVNPETLWRLGDTHAFENPWLLSLNLLFYRYHNRLVEANRDRGWTSDQKFEHARRWVIATLQKITMYDWLPLLVNQKVDEYSGYDPSVNTEITDLFDAAAINYILTLLPSAVHKVDLHCQYVRTENTRLCTTYWHAKDVVEESRQGTVEILRGMTAQLAELDDIYIVEDIRSSFYGPLFYSRHDAIVLTIMKGRDYGLPDYNTARKVMGLPPLNNFDDFLRFNPDLAATPQGRKLVENMRSLHKNRTDRVDIFVGGMMETTPDGPGPLFTRILLNQMYRVRNGDRFWFENRENGLFSEEEVEAIMNTTLSKVLTNISRDMNPMMKPLPDDVFHLTPDHPCQPAIHLNDSELPPCPRHQGFDYFSGSEVPFIIIWCCLGLVPLRECRAFMRARACM